MRPKGPGQGSLGAIIGQFKSRITKRLWKDQGFSGQPVWQRNYYEHVTCNDGEPDLIHRYIETNPLNWAFDDGNPDGQA